VSGLAETVGPGQFWWHVSVREGKSVLWVVFGREVVRGGRRK